MLNKAPIFINGFQRGGTNILLNLIMSHPNICMLGAETHILFYGREHESFKKWGQRFLYLPILLSARQHIFWPYRLQKRNRLPKFIQCYVDLWFYRSKLLAPRNQVKTEKTTMSSAEIRDSRLLCKNVNGVNLATPIFAEMYPDATFFGLVRNGLALCESFIRRGWTAQRIGELYNVVCQQMITDSQKMDNYHIVRFEDILSKPKETIESVYAFANLDIDVVEKFRLQAKQSMNKDGSRKYSFGGDLDRELQWFPLNLLHTCFRRDVNENQISQLSEKDKEIFLEYAAQPMQYFGYL